MTDDSLQSLLARYGLENHVARFEANGVDVVAIGAADDDMAREFAVALSLNIGDRAKLLRLCRDVRDGHRGRLCGVAGARADADGSTPPALEISPAAPATLPLASPLEPDLLDHLPTPIARAAHALGNACDPVHIAVALETFVDTVLRFLALVCQADYLSAPAWFEPKLNDLFEKLDRPPLGVWRSFLECAIKGAQSAGHSLFLMELRDTWERTEHRRPEVQEGPIWNDIGMEERRRNRLGRLEWLGNLRNAYGHFKVSRQNLQDCVAGREVAFRTIRDYRWLRDYELWASDGKAMLLLRGLNGQPTPGGPNELRRKRGVSLRRRSVQSPTGRRTLDLPPLIVSEAMVVPASAGSGTAAATALLYGGIGGPNDALYYAPDPDGGFRPVRTTRHLADLRQRQAAKKFPRLSRSGLDYATLLARTTAASDRSLRILEETQKFRPELHVERNEYEPRLSPWIDSPVPLLGIAAEAGAGKTGILASLVRRWRESSDKPVLFVLARDFQSLATIDRVIRETLILADDVTAVDVAATLTGVVVVVDGLNEHPNRIDILDGIRGLARGALERHAGPRFAISWRTEDAGWMENALSESSLWWTPPSTTTLNSSRDYPARPDIDTKAEIADKKGLSSPRSTGPSGDKSTNAYPSPEQASHPFITVKAFEETEVAEAWERYRTLDPQRMAPRFDWTSLRKECPELAWDLQNPLRMRIAMECYHDRKLPEHLRVEDVFETYLDSLRGRMRGIADLLATLGEMMFETRQVRFEVADLVECRGRDLVYDGSPMSAFDFLVSAGVLSVLDEQGRRAFQFTVERVAEQVLGEYISTLPAAESAESLARLSDDLPGAHLALGPGAIRVALRQRVATEGRGFLYAFIDAQPVDAGRLAGGAIASLVVSAGEAGAASIAQELLVEPTSADFTVAANAADFFSRREAHDIAIAFLEPFVNGERLEYVASTLEAGKLPVQYVECRLAKLHSSKATQSDRQAFLSSPTMSTLVDSLRRLAERGDPPATNPLCALIMHIGQAHERDGRHDDAAAYFREACTMDAGAVRKDPIPERQRRLAIGYEWLGVALRGSGKSDEALAAFEQAIQFGTSPAKCLDWSPAGAWKALAALHRAHKDWDSAIKAEKRLLEVSVADNVYFNAALAASRIGDTYAQKDDHTTTVEWQQHAVDIARRSDNSWLLATTLESLATALRDTRQWDEALEAEKHCLKAWFAEELFGYAATTASRIGDLYTKKGDRMTAIEWHYKAVEIARSDPRYFLGDSYRSLEERDALESLTTALHHAQRWDEAIEVAKQLLEAYIARDKLWEAAETAAQIGVFYAQKGDHATAIEWNHEAVNIARDTGKCSLLADTLEWLGDALHDAGKCDDALARYHDALAERLAVAAADRDMLVRGRFNQCLRLEREQATAGVYLKLGLTDKAYQTLQECEPYVSSLTADPNDNHVDTAVAWWERLAEVLAARGDDAGRTQAQREASLLRERHSRTSATTS